MMFCKGILEEAQKYYLMAINLGYFDAIIKYVCFLKRTDATSTEFEEFMESVYKWFSINKDTDKLNINY